MFVEGYVHVFLLLYLEMIHQYVAELCDVWNCVLGHRNPFIAGKSLAFFISCYMVVFMIKVALLGHLLQLHVKFICLKINTSLPKWEVNLLVHVKFLP